QVKTEVTLNQGLSHHQFQINVTGKLNLLSSKFTFSFSFVLVLLREARLRDRSVAAKKSTAAGGLKSVLKNRPDLNRVEALSRMMMRWVIGGMW
ncbi:unnamed protein product, partial [Brassica oleracea]